MMESDSENKCDLVHEPTYTPTKLPLLISRPNMAADTPPPLSPPQNMISVPFKWEEAPGKPRYSHTDSEPDNSVKKTLELPPRLLFLLDTNVDGPSPTTVLDGPYVGRAVSFTTSYRTPRGYWNSNFGSSRWGGYKKITTDDGEGSFDFSPHCSSTTMSNVKITRVPRRGTFWTLSKQRSQLWASIYESFKQVVPWKRKQQTQKKCASKFDTV
ncbi:uncharacterized protein HKW66_Vig0104790 [Vigna angularis]|uniref:Uncharacterized protein n=3 Tax=Phaseolus angularis TaxID=3914 RepID=A0A8T0KK61_PHAAN|nr:uncharacterized protein At4g00950 [Vigna angularis]KAG2399668.1 uncharacterized protein HKW66_Vig0104790 [Vigna angularis]BAT78848.1 hypothetical protein VIGAN_02159500 [Vigna angularis var. angularis]